MTKRQRTFLFLAAAMLFLLATPAVILYSQGLRIDWENRQLTYTGGIFLKVVPARATILLNDAFVKRTDFFFDSALLTNLIPGNYEVIIEKEGYTPWEKTLPVQKAQVTEEKNIILFPQEISFHTLFSDILNFWQSPDENTFLFQKKLDSRTWQLVSWNVQDKKEIILWESSSTGAQDVIWSADSRAIALKTASRYLVFDLKGQTSDPCVATPCSLDFLETTTSELAFKVPEIPTEEVATLSNELGMQSPDAQKSVFIQGATLFVLFPQKQIELALETFATTPENLVWLNSNYLFATVNDQVLIIEVDEIGMPNIMNLGTFKQPKLSWNTQEKSVFLLSETKFLVSEKLLP